ncbi:MAG: hypothetical protein ACOCXJ_04650 [Planctomycetota bacterium]
MHDDAAADAAWGWLQGYGRVVERSLAAHLRRNGSIDAVIAALEAYRCPDGGYGHDLAPGSGAGASVAATCAALERHRRIGTPPEESGLQEALGWSLARLCGADALPLLGSGGVLLGHLLEDRARARIPPVQRLLHELRRLLAACGRPHPEQIGSLADLRRSRGLTRRDRAQLDALLEPALRSHPWPTTLLAGPGDPLVRLVPAERLVADLAHLRRIQASDGSWSGPGDDRARTSCITEHHLRLLALG